MSFNIGELEGTITLQSNVDDVAGEVVGAISGLSTSGAAAASKAGKAIGDALKVDTSSVEKAIDGIKKTLDQQTGAVTQNTKAWAANEIGADKLRDLERLGVSTKDYIDAISGVPAAQLRMQAALAGNSDALRDLDRLTGQVASAQRNLETEARAVGGAMQEAEQGTGQFGSSLEGFSGQVDDVIGKLRELGSGGQAAAATAGAMIGAGLALAIAAAFDADNVTRQIAGALGKTVDESAKYGKAAGTLFANNYGESLEQAGEAITSVIRNMRGFGDVSEDVLVGIAGQVLNVAQTFDEDLNAVTRSAGQLMKTGLARNAQEALDIVTAGFQSPVNAAEDLLDTIDEYSTIFRSLGLDGKDALGILSQGLQAGARDADTVADSFKELLLRLQAGDSKKAITDLGLNFQAATEQIAAGGAGAKATVDLIIDRLNAVEDPATRSALAVELFGTKAEDMQSAIAGLDVSSAASEFEAAYGTIAGAADRLDETIGGSLQAGFDGVLRSASGLVSELGSNLAPVISAAAGAFRLLFDILRGALDFIFDLPGPLVAIGVAVAVWASWSTIAAAATALAGGIVAISVAARAALASLGPIGILITAVGTAMAFLTDNSDAAEDAISAQATYFENLATTLDQATGAITANTAATIKKQAIDSGMAATLSAAGISLETYTQAALGNKDAQEQLATGIARAKAEALGAGGAFAGLEGVLAGAKVSQEELATALATGDWTDVTAKVSAYADAQGRASGQIGTTTGIMDQFTAAMTAAGGPVNSLDAIMLEAGVTAQELATAQANVAAMTAGTSDAAAAAYANLLAMATVSSLSADEIARMGSAAGLTAPQIQAIQEAAGSAGTQTSLLSEALADGASAADDMNGAVTILQLALDTLAGNEISAEQASRAHAAVIREAAASTRDHAAAQAELVTKQAELTEMQNSGTASTAQLEAAQRAVAAAQDAVAASADGQKDSLDNLANSAQGMTARSFEGAGGMGNFDAAVRAATQTMINQRTQFIASARDAGYSQEAAENLANAQGLIPSDVKTAYEAIRVQEAKEAAGGVKRAVDDVPKNSTTSLNVNDNATSIVRNLAGELRALNGYSAWTTVGTRYVTEGNPTTKISTPGTGGIYMGGQVGPFVSAWEKAQGYSDGGLVPGTPPTNPSVDNVMASAMGVPIKLRSREFVQPEPAVDHYGVPFMEAVRRRTFPKPKGYAGGGPVDGQPGYTGGGAPIVNVEARFLLDGKEIAGHFDVIVDGKLRESRVALDRKAMQTT